MNNVVHQGKVHPATLIINNPFVTCHYCRGYGVVDGFEGPNDCPECKGDTVIRDRDAKGRFKTHPFLYKHIGGGEYEYVGPAKGQDK